ncbi:hypothetical protein [Microbacterium esteraromaticum]|uniref:hypothetical protein n=1 Tax=Microbacterium esteraromaticum TaxID=57043 RepID=UPI00195CC313|nr:hypothetical protein [Microbacterium esteraromaticum]MBM7467097.1 glycosyltransferase involved in cell wall biosynthesis [Microbacterium esteraromaticum]
MSSSGASDRRGPAVRALLELEDACPDELFETLPGATVPLWAIVRMRFAWALSEAQTGSVDVTSDNWSRRAEARRLVKAYLPNRWDAARRARPHEVLFYVGGGTLAASDGRARNWLIHDFAEAADDALVVQRLPLPAPLGPPEYRPTLSMEAGIARSRLRSRGQRPSDELVRAADRLLGRFATHLRVPESKVAAIRTRVLRTEVARPHEQDELRRMLERVRPRVVVMDTAAYTYNGETVGLFKDFGAYVAEPQHGWIGPSHAAYNYGRAFQDERLRRALPDEVLTFGRRWSDSISFPGVATAIGKPHLERLAANAGRERRRQVLVVSSRARPEATDEFVTRLRRELDEGWTVVFRPHPAERDAAAARYPLIASAEGISFDTEPDVYASLARARVVVGVASTVLFEAAAFGCAVIARDDEFAERVIGDSFGERVQSAEAAALRIRALDADSAAQPEADPALWSQGATKRFSAWLDGRLRADQEGVIG